MKPTPTVYFTTLLRDRATGRVLLWHRSEGPFCCAIRQLWPGAAASRDPTYTDVWINHATVSQRFVPGAVQVFPRVDQPNGGGHA